MDISGRKPALNSPFQRFLFLPLCLKESIYSYENVFSRQVHFMQLKLSSSERCCARTSLDIGVRGSKNLTEFKNKLISQCQGPDGQQGLIALGMKISIGIYVTRPRDI